MGRNGDGDRDGDGDRGMITMVTNRISLLYPHHAPASCQYHGILSSVSWHPPFCASCQYHGILSSDHGILSC